MINLFYKTAVLLISLAMLAACGAKGDLYLPEDNAQVTQQQEKPEKKSSQADDQQN